jgi:hypothetical protein
MSGPAGRNTVSPGAVLLVSNTGRLEVGFTHRPYWLQAGVTYCGNCRITRMRRMMFSERLRLCVADSSHSRHSCDSAGPGVRSPTTRHRRIVRRVTKKAVVAVTTASSQQCHHIRSYQSGRPDSNRRRPAWEAGILPTELRPRSDIVESHRSGLNRRPLDYESSALPLSYCGGVQPCPGADSNRDALRHHPLKMACLPISPPGHLPQRSESGVDSWLLIPTPTGLTGLEPATSGVTDRHSNQAELQPPNSYATLIAPTGVEPVSAP